MVKIQKGKEKQLGLAALKKDLVYFESPGEGYLGYHWIYWILYDTVSHRIHVW